jgi:quercetin dioxygenase-like cupin family protein
MIRLLTRLTAALLCFAGGAAAHASFQAPTYRSAGGTEIRVLADESTIGGREVEVAEIQFPAGSDSGDHRHAVTELFYVLSGELEHSVNGRAELLKPGMVGSVRPPDSVRHRAPNGAVTALVIWAPGGEAARITSRWQRRQ